MPDVSGAETSGGAAPDEEDFDTVGQYTQPGSPEGEEVADVDLGDSGSFGSLDPLITPGTEPEVEFVFYEHPTSPLNGGGQDGVDFLVSNTADAVVDGTGNVQAGQTGEINPMTEADAPDAAPAMVDDMAHL